MFFRNFVRHLPDRNSSVNIVTILRADSLRGQNVHTVSVVHPVTSQYRNSSVSIVTILRAVRSLRGSNVHTVSVVHPFTSQYRHSFPAVKRSKHETHHHLHLPSTLRMSGATPQLPLYDLMECVYLFEDRLRVSSRV